jgi:hypothetical protein
VFAQDAPALKFNGYLNMGALVSAQAGTTNLLSYGQDSWTPGRFQLEGKYADTNWGWAFRMRSDADWTTGQPVYMKRAYGWVTGLNGMIKVQAGRLGSYAWSSNQWQSFGQRDGAAGIQLDIMPVAGADLGVFLPTWSSGTDTALLSDAFNSLMFGASYTNDMLYAAVGYDLGNKYLWAGVSYTGMSALTAYVESKINLDSTTANNFVYLDERVAYNMAPLNVGLWAEQQFNSTAGVPSTLLHFQPSVDYTMGVWNLGVLGSFATDTTDSGYGVGAWAKATVGKTATVALGAQYDLGTLAPANAKELSNGDPLYGPQVTAANAATGFGSQTDNLFRTYLDFVWSF